MCGIFGAVKKESFLDLYDLNRKRGTFSTSLVIYTTTSDMIVHRWSGSITVKEASKEIDESLKKQKVQPYFFLGHTQAPTSMWEMCSACRTSWTFRMSVPGVALRASAL
jgi:hypothetical protein